MNLNPIEICILVIDVSTSMNKVERIGEVNKALEKFQVFIRGNKKIEKKLFILIVEFSTKTIVHPPKRAKDFIFPILNANGGTKIDKGISTAIDELKKWKNNNQPSSIVANVYFVLITDLKSEEIEKSVNEYNWVRFLKELGRKSNFTFMGFGVDNGNLNLLKHPSYPNFFIYEDLNINSLFDNIIIKIENDFKKPWYKTLCNKISILGSSIDWNINNFLRKQLKKELEIQGIGISILGLSILGGIQFLSVNINFYINKNKIENTFKIESEEILQDYKKLKDNNQIIQNSDLDIELELGNVGIYPSDVEYILSYAYVDSLENFIKGQYRIDDSESLFNSGLLIQKHLNRLVQIHFQDANEVFVSIQGETDAYRILVPIAYQGEFGNLDIHIRNNQNLQINKGDKFDSNITLAILRAVSFWTFIRGREDLFTNTKTKYIYQYKTNDFNYGGKYRKVMIKIYIH